MSSALKPLYCLADSQLLFARTETGAPRLAALLDELPPVGARAAYIGAANRDEPAFFSLFEAAMDVLGLPERHFIRSGFAAEDQAALARADLIVLGGGDPLVGWRSFEQTGLGAAIRERRDHGAVLLGVSAGAVQLGWLAAPERSAAEDLAASETVVTFRFVPGVVGVHEEQNDWRPLRRLVRASGLSLRAFGIASGGGLVVHPDHSLEPLRHPVIELTAGEHGLVETLLSPAAVPHSAASRTS